MPEHRENRPVALGDTRMVEGAAVGVLAGLVIAAITSSAKAAAALVTIGAGAGGVVGANVPRRRRVVFLLRDLLPASW